MMTHEELGNKIMELQADVLQKHETALNSLYGEDSADKARHMYAFENKLIELMNILGHTDLKITYC